MRTTSARDRECIFHPLCSRQIVELVAISESFLSLNRVALIDLRSKRVVACSRQLTGYMVLRSTNNFNLRANSSARSEFIADQIRAVRCSFMRKGQPYLHQSARAGGNPRPWRGTTRERESCWHTIFFI